MSYQIISVLPGEVMQVADDDFQPLSTESVKFRVVAQDQLIQQLPQVRNPAIGN